MTQLRPHGGKYEDEMQKIVNISDLDDVLSYMHVYHFKQKPAKADIAQRHFGRDHRNGWDAWLITLRGRPMMWTDGPVTDVPDELEMSVSPRHIRPM